ncbi:MAG: putative Ig domain-containing protein [Nanoarchaeota archaeon]|nr:hypothetical protein [Nanoarchaeota archaeon]MBU1029695.1 hypothetical protein [Nanoarchaeota archaeon]MBU1849707.1 hypothetical protein [Nanoarchaeota archaeon]
MKKLFLLVITFLLTLMVVSANPVVNAISGKTVAEGSVLSFDVTCSTPDSGATTFTHNGTAGTLTKTNDTLAVFSWTPGYSAAGTYSYNFTVADVDSSSSTTMTIIVTNTNRNPTITSTPTTSVVKNHLYTYNAIATDLDSDVITFSLISPQIGMVINSTSGVMTWTPTILGNYTVKVKAADVNGGSYTQNYTLTVLDTTYSLRLSDVTLGDEREENHTATLTVENIGSETITNIAISDNVPSDYQIGYSAKTIASLAAGASTTIIVEGYIPDNQDSGKENVGTMTATGTSNGQIVTGTGKLYIEAENNLIINDMTITVDDDDESVDDGDKIEVRPGSTIIMEIELKNTNRDYDIEDIELNVYDEDGDLDIDESEDGIDIKDGKRETITFEFVVDNDADEETYEVIIEVYGEDENGATHGETWEIDFEVDRKTHEVIVTRTIVDTITCGQKEFDLQIRVENTGTRDEDEVAIEVKSTTLDYNEIIYDLELDEGDDLERTFTIPIPEGTTTGTKTITIYTYYDNDEESDIAYAYLTMPTACGVTDDTTTEEDSTGIIVQQPDGTDLDDSVLIDSSTGKETKSAGLGDNILTIVLLVLANLLVLTIIVILVVKYLFK